MFLNAESYYNDLYDLFTVQECLGIIDRWQSHEKVKNLPKDQESLASWGLEFQLYFVKGERFKRRGSTIKEWMQKDRLRDEKLEQTSEPTNIICPSCSKKMAVIFKDLHDLDIDSLRVLFFFECPACKKRKGVFEDGEFWERQSEKVENKDDDNYYAELKEKREKERVLLLQHRDQFCLSDEKGYEYMEAQRNLEALAELIKKAEQKKTDPDYKKAEQLKKLSIVELEKFLSESLEKQKYIKLIFDKPDIDRYVIVPFTVQEADSSRKQADSQRRLQKALKSALEGSNWRLMSEGVTYRLGCLSGRLKGYENEEDLVQIVKQDKAK